METNLSILPPRLQEIVEDFRSSSGAEKIELLLEYSNKMPPLPAHISQNHDRMDFVEECMTPVYVTAEKVGDGLSYYFDIPPESPTVRGFAALLAEGLNGATPQQILSVPGDFYQQMGLDNVLSIQRLNGISAILAHMKRLAAEKLATEPSD